MRFTGTGSECAIALGAETSFGAGNTTLTEFLAASTFEVNYDVNRHDPGDGQLAMKIPAYSARMDPEQTWRFTMPLWAEGLEFFYQFATGRYQQSDDLDVTQGAYAHLFYPSSGAIPMAGPNPDTLCDGMAMGFWTGDLTPAKGRFIKLRGALVSRWSVNIGQNAATLSAEGIFYDASFDSTPPTVGWDSAYLYSPNRTNISFNDVSTGAIDQSTNTHWDPYSFRLDWDNKINQEFAMGNSGATFFRTPETPHREGAIDVRVTFETETRAYDATMLSVSGYSFRRVYEENRPHTGYVEMFGDQIANSTAEAGGLPLRRAWRFEWDYAKLTKWGIPLAGGGQLRQRCEALLLDPPGSYYGELAKLYVKNGRVGFAQYPSGL